MESNTPTPAKSLPLLTSLTEAAHFCQLFDDWPQRVYLKDLSSRFVYANRAVLSAAQCSLSELIGKTDAELFDTPHAADAKQMESQLIAGAQPPLVDRYELETWKETGRVACVATTKRPVTAADGSMLGLLGITRELTVVERELFLEQIAYKNKVPPPSIDSSISADSDNVGFWWRKCRNVDEFVPDHTEIQRDSVFAKEFPEATGIDRMKRVFHEDRKHVISFLRSSRTNHPGDTAGVDFRARPSSHTGHEWMRASSFTIRLDNQSNVIIISMRRITNPRVGEFLGQKMLNEFGGLLFVKDADFNFKFMNGVMLRMFDRELKDVLNKSDEELNLIPVERRAFKIDDESVLKGETTIRCERLTVPGREDKLELLTIKQPIPADVFDPGANPKAHATTSHHILGMSLILPRSDAWNDWRIQHSLMEYIKNSYSDAIYVKELSSNKTAIYAAANDAFCKMVGKDLGEVLHQTTETVWNDSNPELVGVMTTEDDALFSGREEVRCNSWRATKTPCGQLQFRHTEKYLLRDNAGRPWRILGVSRDVSQIKAQSAIDPQLVPHLHSFPVERRIITVVFCDIRGFTSLASSLVGQDRVLMDLYNRFFNVVCEYAVKHGCIFDKLQGDGVIIVSGAIPLLGQGDEGDRVFDGQIRAARFALNLQKEFSRQVEEWHEENEDYLPHRPEVRLGIGIHTGEANVGLLETRKRKNNDEGPAERMELIALGDTVNKAQRIESAAGRGNDDILVSACVRKALDGRFIVSKCRSIEVKDGRIRAARLLDEK